MIKKILIANRGEAACRIVRTCREMGIATVAVYSDEDSQALHVEIADEAVRIGSDAAHDSYMNIDKVITAAKRTGADAIHPGYGFLAENATFAQTVTDAGLNFIGPPPHAIQAMSSKKSAKQLLKGVPGVPGYIGDDQSDTTLIKAAGKIGYPVIVKASAGRGGKGIWQVATADDFPSTLKAARQEANQAFGDDSLILEQVVPHARHIEVQIFGDKLGNVIALGERERTIQRRYQQIIEETPSPLLTLKLRMAMFEAAVSLGTQLGYYSAGTVGFLVDDAHHFYFTKMNMCLQNEHSITEETTGFDLVRWQIMVAEGFPLPDMDVYPAGHAIAVQIYAEDPTNEFLPATGEILRWREPDDVRVDAGVYDGDKISLHHDPMLATVIAYGEHRQGAIRRLDYALSKLQLLGVKNNIAFLRRILMHPDHLAGNFTSTFIAEHAEVLTDRHDVPVSAWIAAAIAKIHPQDLDSLVNNDKYVSNIAFRPFHERFRYGSSQTDLWLTQGKNTLFAVKIGEQHLEVELVSYQDGDMILAVDGHRQKLVILQGADDCWWVYVNGESYDLTSVSLSSGGI